MTHFVPVTMCFTQRTCVNLRLYGVTHIVTGTKCVTRQPPLPYSSISMLTGQWSLPKTSLWMLAAVTLSAIESLTRK